MLGAVGGYAFACRVLKQDKSFPVMVILAIAVWITYITDHLLDSLGTGNPLSLKYKFFAQNRKPLLTVLILMFLTAILLVFNFLSLHLIIIGAIIGMGLFVYLVVQHFLKGRFRKCFPKEVLISFIYIVAIWCFPVMQAGGLPKNSFLFAGIHFLMVFTNVMLFSYFEQAQDIRYEKVSVFTKLKEGNFRIIIVSTIVLCLISIGGAIIIFQRHIFTFPLLCISLVYLFEILFYHKQFSQNSYSQLTDGAFLLFLIYLA